VLLVVTVTPAPIATELFTWVDVFGVPEFAPTKTLLVPVVVLFPANLPTKVFWLPVVVLNPAPRPTYVFDCGGAGLPPSRNLP